MTENFSRTENCEHGDGVLCKNCDPLGSSIYGRFSPNGQILPLDSFKNSGILPAPVNQGWQCPACKKCYAPFVAGCHNCNHPKGL